MSADSVQDIKRHVRTYIYVFVALAVLTVVTVLASYLDAGVALAVFIALLIATVKGSLVAGFFMHLVSEKKPIYWLLMLTAVFFLFLMFLPLSGYWDSTGS